MERAESSRYKIKLAVNLSEEEFQELSQTRKLTLKYADRSSTSSNNETDHFDTNYPHYSRPEGLQHNAEENIEKKNKNTSKLKLLSSNVVSVSTLSEMIQSEPGSGKRKTLSLPEPYNKKTKPSSKKVSFSENTREQDILEKSVLKANQHEKQEENQKEIPDHCKVHSSKSTNKDVYLNKSKEEDAKPSTSSTSNIFLHPKEDNPDNTAETTKNFFTIPREHKREKIKTIETTSLPKKEEASNTSKELTEKTTIIEDSSKCLYNNPNKYLLKAILFTVFEENNTGTTSQKNSDKELLLEFQKHKGDIFQPCIQIVGFAEELTGRMLIEAIIDENRFIDKNTQFVIKSLNVPRMNRWEGKAILQCDPTTLKAIAERKQIRIKGVNCHVYKKIYITRCQKCGEYGHTLTKCYNVEICFDCGTNTHLLRERCNRTASNCPNCSFANNILERNFDINHTPQHLSCPVWSKLYHYSRQLSW